MARNGPLGAVYGPPFEAWNDLAARHLHGTAILYADTMTDSMKAAIGETERRRAKQIEFNARMGITPKGVARLAQLLAPEAS